MHLTRDEYEQQHGKGKTVYLVARIISIVGVLSLMPVLNIIDHTINGMRLTWSGVVVGLVIATLCTVILKKKKPEAYFDKRRTQNLNVSFFVGFMALGASLGNYINWGLADKELVCQTYKIDTVSSAESYSEGTGSRVYYVFIVINNKRERFQVWKNIYDKISATGSINVYVQHGALGFDYVKTFKVPDAP
jgi:hypothetical protein